MGPNQLFQRLVLLEQNDYWIGGQTWHGDLLSPLRIRHATTQPIRLLKTLHPRWSQNFRSDVLAAMTRHVPLLLASLAAIFLVAPIAIIVPMSFSSAISFEFPPPGYWTGYYAQYFSSHSWLDATANSFIIALGYYSFLSLAYLVGTHAGMIIAHSVLSIPVAFLVISAALKGFDRNLERAAMSAGAGPLRTFLWVTLPVLRPGILVGALFAFLHSFNEAVVAIFIAGRDAATLPKKMFESIRLESDPVIAVVSTLLTGSVLLGVLISLFFRQRPANAA